MHEDSIWTVAVDRAQMRPSILHCTEAVNTNFNTIVHVIHLTHVLSVYKCVKPGVFRSVVKPFLWRKII